MTMNPTDPFPRPGAHHASGSLIYGACVTPEEHEAAVLKCQSEVVLRGTGQFGPMELRQYDYDEGRWAGMPPCDVAELPICDCATDLDAYAISGCFNGIPPPGWSPEYHDNWCAQVGGGLLYSNLCPGSAPPYVPECLAPGEREGLGYCTTYGFTGPNTYANSLCWGAIKTGALAQMLARPDCPPAYQDAPPPPPVTPPPPDVVPPPPPVSADRSAMVVSGLILLLIAGGGTAYYVAQRKKKRRR